MEVNSIIVYHVINSYLEFSLKLHVYAKMDIMRWIIFASNAIIPVLPAILVDQKAVLVVAIKTFDS